MLPAECRVSIEPPAYLILEAEGIEHRIDPYDAQRKLQAIAAQTPEPAAQWERVKALLADYLHILPNTLAENQARQFNEAVTAFCARLDDVQKKTSESIACWQPLIQAFPATTAVGPSGVSGPGSPTGAG